jgi:hypothetical protein
MKAEMKKVKGKAGRGNTFWDALLVSWFLPGPSPATNQNTVSRPPVSVKLTPSANSQIPVPQIPGSSPAENAPAFFQLGEALGSAPLSSFSDDGNDLLRRDICLNRGNIQWRRRHLFWNQRESSSVFPANQDLACRFGLFQDLGKLLSGF